MATDFLDPELKRRIERLVGECLLDYRRVEGGYTPALRLVCQSERRKLFVKVGTTALTSNFLRREFSIYERVSGSFMPQLLGWEDHEQEPILAIEDLSMLHWPPPWSSAQIDRVLTQIGVLHGTKAPVETFEQFFAPGLSGWESVADDPEPFLALGYAGAGWLEASLETLLEYESRCPTSGESLTHFDLRSDNIAIGDNRSIFVDWNHACLSNPRLDTGFWLPSLAYEGGPEPEAILPDAPEVAAKVSGYFASRAGLPPIPDAPKVRQVQHRQLETALLWVVRALELAPLVRPG